MATPFSSTVLSHEGSSGPSSSSKNDNHESHQLRRDAACGSPISGPILVGPLAEAVIGESKMVMGM